MRRAKAKPNDRASTRDISDEIRRLQKTYALLIAVQDASNHNVEFDVSDALAVIVALVEDSLQGLDRLEASSDGEVPDGRK